MDNNNPAGDLVRGGLGAGVPGVAPAEHGHQEQRGPEEEVGGGQRPQQPHPAHTLLQGTPVILVRGG